MQIVTNNHKRDFLYGYDVPESIREEDYDYLNEDEKFDHWILYRGEYYHLSDFIRTRNCHWSEGNPYGPLGWDGYFTDTFFSAIVIKIVDEGFDLQYIIGTAFA